MYLISFVLFDRMVRWIGYVVFFVFGCFLLFRLMFDKNSFLGLIIFWFEGRKYLVVFGVII